jgi:hypothetical protein
MKLTLATLPVAPLLKNFRILYGILGLNTSFRGALHESYPVNTTHLSHKVTFENYSSLYFFVFLVVSFLLVFTKIIHTHSSSSLCVSHALFLPFDFSILIILREVCKLRTSPLCSFCMGMECNQVHYYCVHLLTTSPV